MPALSKLLASRRSWGAAPLLFFCLAPIIRAQSALPEGKGKDVLERMCGSQCHGPDVATSERLSKQGWSNIVDTMISRGATGTDEEIELVIDYLATHFGRDKPPSGSSSPSAAGSKINVNTATAKGLATTLELSSEEARAIVECRQKQGKFNNWDDLLKVPKVEVKKLEGKKDRITF